MSDDRPWWQSWKFVDKRLRKISAKAQKMVKRLRLARFLVLVLFLLPLVAAGLIIWKPAYTQYALALIAIYVAVPLIAIWFLLGVPLRAKSIVRLIDMGYPKNVKELAIRAAAKKLHEESIETEELLVDTAINESKKALRKYRERAERLKEELDKPRESKSEDDE